MRPALMPSSYAPNIGGVETVAQHLAHGLDQAGHTPVVITNRWPKSLPAAEDDARVQVVRANLRVPHRSVRGLAGWLAMSALTRRELVAHARDSGVDVVNVHCVSSNARYALAISRTLGVPLVVSVHGELSGDAARVYQRSGYLRRSWRDVIAAADVVTAPSAYALDEAEAFWGAELGERARVVPNGVDLALFACARRASGRPFAFAAGRLVANKGFDVLVEAWAGLPVGDLDLVIAGDGPARHDLERHIGERGLAARITLIGSLSQVELARRLAAATVFVLPSRAEAFGLAVLESMAARTPVIATAVGGVPELIEDGVTGLLVAPSDPAALRDAILNVLREPSAAGARAARAYLSAAQLSWARYTEAFLDVYRQAGVA